MKKTVKIYIILMLGMFLCVGNVLANVIEIDFTVRDNSAGNIDYDGGLAPLRGDNIIIDSVIGFHMPGYIEDTLVVKNAELTFYTGNSNGNWTWGASPDSSIIITGDIDYLGLVDATLLEGNFGTAYCDYTNGYLVISGASFFDYKHIDILNYYGIDPSLEFIGSFDIHFISDAAIGDEIHSTIIKEGTIVNLPTPEPATLFLLGLGMLGIAAIDPRKIFKK